MSINFRYLRSQLIELLESAISRHPVCCTTSSQDFYLTICLFSSGIPDRPRKRKQPIPRALMQGPRFYRRKIGSLAARSGKAKAPSGRERLSPLIARTRHGYRRNFLDHDLRRRRLAFSRCLSRGRPPRYLTSRSLSATVRVRPRSIYKRGEYRRGEDTESRKIAIVWPIQPGKNRFRR